MWIVLKLAKFNQYLTFLLENIVLSYFVWNWRISDLNVLGAKATGKRTYGQPDIFQKKIFFGQRTPSSWETEFLNWISVRHIWLARKWQDAVSPIKATVRQSKSQAKFVFVKPVLVQREGELHWLDAKLPLQVTHPISRNVWVFFELMQAPYHCLFPHHLFSQEKYLLSAGLKRLNSTFLRQLGIGT